MAGKARPSLRAKTLANVERSNLSNTDKECIRVVFKRIEDEEWKKWNIATADVVETEILKEHLRNLTGMFTDELGFVLSLNVVLDAIDFVREKRKEGGAE